MCNEEKFFIYLIERYADYKSSTADRVLREWDKLGLTDFILSMYEMYHTEAIENAFEDIDNLIAEKVH